MIKNSTLDRQDRLLAYNAFLLPQVLYTTPCMQADPAQLKKIHRPALELALNALGMNRHYPQVMAYTGLEYFGLDLNDYAASQGVAQLEMYVGHCRRKDHTGTLLLIEKEYVEIIVGRGQCPLEHPESAMVDYVEDSWIISLAGFLHWCQGQVITKTQRVVEKQCNNDKFIMSHTNVLGGNMSGKKYSNADSSCK